MIAERVPSAQPFGPERPALFRLRTLLRERTREGRCDEEIEHATRDAVRGLRDDGLLGAQMLIAIKEVLADARIFSHGAKVPGAYYDALVTLSIREYFRDAV